MAVETRVIIDANASNAIREIGKLDDAAADTDKTLNELDGQTVDVDTSASVDGMDALRRMGDDAIAAVKALSQVDPSISVDTSGIATAAGDVDALQADAKTGVHMEIDVDADKLDRVKTKTDAVESSGRAAGAAVGTIGGAISEIPAVSALGPVAEGLGQLSEAALEGEANIGDLAAALGAMVVVAGVMKAVADHSKQIAANKAFRTDQVDDYATVLEGADSTLGAILEKLKEGDGLLVSFFGSPEDVTGVFTALGTGVDDVAKLIDGGIPTIDAWAEALRNAGADSDAVAIASQVLKQNVEDLDKAQQNAKTTTQFLSDETDRAVGSWDAAHDSVVDLAGGLDDATLATARLEAANAKLRGDLDKREAYLNLMDQFDALKTAGQEAWDATATGAADAESKARDYEQAQIDTKNAVLDYTDTVGAVPTDVTTNLIAEVDAGQVDSLKTDVDDLTNGTKYVDIRVRTTIDQAWQSVVNGVRFGGTRS